MVEFNANLSQTQVIIKVVEFNGNLSQTQVIIKVVEFSGNLSETQIIIKVAKLHGNLSQTQGWREVLQPLRGAARNLPEVPGDNCRAEMPRGLGFLTRGLNPNVNEGLSPSSPVLVPQVSTEEVDGSAFHNLPGFEWNSNMGTAQIDSLATIARKETGPLGRHIFLPPKGSS